MIDLNILAFIDAAQIMEWFINHCSYWMVFLLMTLESTFIPFPSEVVVPPAAYLAVTTENMSVIGVFICATAGALLGGVINYYLALWIGRPLVYAFADSRLGHACLLDREKVDRAEVYFDKHGAISTFIGRLIPVIRQLISLPAGLARMNIGVFCLYTALGAGLWNAVLCGLGYWLGQSVPLDQLFPFVEKYNGYLSIAGWIICGVCVLFILYNAFKPHKNTIKKE